MDGILIVSGDGFLRIILRDILEKNNCHVVCEAADSRGALECYKEFEPDIIIMDSVLKDVAGDKAALSILNYDSKAQIVMAALEDDNETVKNSIKNGISDFIVTPVKADEVLETVRKLKRQSAL